MRLLDPHHSFFDAPIARWAVIASLLLWAGVEAWMGAYIWAALFVALAGYAAFMLLILRPRERAAAPAKPPVQD